MYYQYLVCCFFHPVRNTIRWSFHFFPLLQLEARHWRDLLLIGKIHSKRRQATNNLCRLVLLLLLFCCMLCFPFRHCFVVVLLATIGFEVETGDLHTMSCLSAGWSSSPRRQRSRGHQYVGLMSQIMRTDCQQTSIACHMAWHPAGPSKP